MKKIFILLFSILSVFVIVGCKKTTTTITTTTTTKTTTTTTRTTTTTTTTKTTTTTSSSNGLSTPVTDSETLALMATYYKKLDLENLINESKSTIKTKVADLLKKATINYNYNSLKEYFLYADEDPENPGYIQLFYSHYLVKKSAFTSGCWSSWNREHVWPQSLGQSKDQPGGHDVLHLRPTFNDINSARGNLKYGNVPNGKTVTYTKHSNPLVKNNIYGYRSSSTFEPLDFAKGDCARIVFYYALKYNYDLKVIVSDNTFKEILEWNRLDPVAPIEISRNNYAYDLQGNRNIFVDYPELAEYIWG